VAPGQAVAAGAALAEIIRLDRLWIRVPVYAGQVREIARDLEATVHSLSTSDRAAPVLVARPVRAPPSANPDAASVDLFYEVRGAIGSLRPGERLSVTLPRADRSERALAVPLEAVLYDMEGGTWIYLRTDSLTFVRRRVEVTRVVGGRAVVGRGVEPGALVVTAGAVELFGTEFGVGK
jgi:multidrug efflux pump subunit AcrA (membrane-fusion protein)